MCHEISNQKIHSKLLILEKYNDTISNFNFNQKNIDNKIEFNKSQKDEIKLAKPKIYISSSLLFGTTINENKKENRDYLNNTIDKKNDYLICNKLIYSNIKKRNKIYSSKKDKETNNNFNINNNIKDMKNNNLNNKTYINFSQKKLREDNLNFKNTKLCKKIFDCSLQTGIASQRKK